MARETYRRGSIALVRFPYTDLSDSKVRPAEIVTADAYLALGGDVLCAFISSILPDPLLPTDIIISATHPDFRKTGLKQSSVLRTHKLVLLDRELVYSKLGDLSPAFMGQMDAALKDALGLDG